MNTAFSHALRVTVCASCGAALHVALDGGEVTCDVCAADMVLAARREGLAPKAVDEADRVAALEAQDKGPLKPPKAVAALTVDGALTDDNAPEAMNSWQKTRAELVTQSASLRSEERDDLALRFYFLTRLLYERLLPQDDDLQLRGILEAAMEAVGHARYRQTFRCMLACEAARVGDLTGAEDWLGPCDAQARDIHADSVYRYSRAFVASHKRQWAQVIDVLGPTHRDVPLATSFDAMCTVLRANAHEKREDVGAAIYELSEGAQRFDGGLEHIEQIIRGSGDLLLCRRSYGNARKLIAGDEPAAKVASKSWSRSLPWVVLSLVFFGFAVGVRNGATIAGLPLDMLFLVLGGAFTLPLVAQFFQERG
jgi:hypothetical protein